MTKEQHIDFWMNTSEEDWITVGVLFSMDRYFHSLLWAHLMIAKLAKALWIKRKANLIPPETDNILWFLNEAEVDLGNDLTEFLSSFSEFQLSNQNPDGMNFVYRVCTKEFTKQELEKVKEVRKSLLKMLP